MGRAMARLRRRQSEGTFVLQITSMIDIFVIMVFFLLKSYSSSSVESAGSTSQIRLPTSISESSPVESLKLMVSKTGIFVDDKKVADLKDGKVGAEALDANDAQFIKPLFEALDKEAEKSKGIAAVNEAVKFEGKIVVQADESLNYELLRKVMYTATLAGFNDLKLAAVKPE
ncbi:MAG TPA: biopolymer transporter ExbD [Bdellovibrionales bacterium]|nr:biopolymer transporter ExbD [Bdellovibrionales bacterium]